MLTKVLVESKGKTVRFCPKEAGAQSDEPEPVLSQAKELETAYKAKSPGKLAPHNKARDSGDMVNAAVAS